MIEQNTVNNLKLFLGDKLIGDVQSVSFNYQNQPITKTSTNYDQKTLHPVYSMGSPIKEEPSLESSDKKPTSEHPVHNQLLAIQLLLAEHLSEKELKKWSSVIKQVMIYIDYLEEDNHCSKSHSEQVYDDLRSTLGRIRDSYKKSKSTSSHDLLKYLGQESLILGLIERNFETKDL